MFKRLYVNEIRKEVAFAFYLYKNTCVHKYYIEYTHIQWYIITLFICLCMVFIPSTLSSYLRFNFSEIKVFFFSFIFMCLLAIGCVTHRAFHLSILFCSFCNIVIDNNQRHFFWRVYKTQAVHRKLAQIFNKCYSYSMNTLKYIFKKTNICVNIRAAPPFSTYAHIFW